METPDNSTMLDRVDARTRLAGSNKMEILLFSLGTRETFGINVFKVREVTKTPKITRTPNMPDGVEGVISLSHTFDCMVVAEGVEKPEHRVLLAGWGADLLQGWVFSKSMSGPAFADYVLSNPIAPLGPAGATRAGARLPVSQSA